MNAFHTRWSIPALLVLGLLLAGCGTVQNLSGVEMATPAIEPSATPAPSATPDPAALALPNTASKDFLGTVITVNYPDGWSEGESGQSLFVFDPDPAFQNGNGPGLGMFVAVTRSIQIDQNLEQMAPLAMHLYLQRGADAGFVARPSVPAADQAYGFEWSGHDAAIFPWRDDESGTVGVQMLVMTDDRRRFVLIGSSVSTDLWPDFEPVWLAVTSSFTLNDTVFSADELQAAYQSALAG